MNSTVQNARSIQIMDFEEAAEENAVRKAVFFEEEFRRVIKNCDVNRPVAVLTVAGKGNKGKSLFLSFALRYLQALQTGKADWMGWTIRQLKRVRASDGPTFKKV